VSKRILVIDDDRAIALAATVRLRAAGYEVYSALDGRSGLAAAEACRPDVILLDSRMPDIDGFEVARRLADTPELSNVPVIFVSANAQEQAKQTALSLGAKAYLSKPYDPEHLLSAVRTAVATQCGHANRVSNVPKGD
jgi:two-component system KDP operon response regulator KdpE